MAVNDTIKYTDYNNIRNAVIEVLGAGSATYGYGQTPISASVAIGNKVTVNEWSNLRYDILNASLHQNGSYATVPSKTEGQTVAFNASTEPVTYYSTLAATLASNRFNVGSGQFGVATAVPKTFTSAWSVQLRTTVTAIWADANAARYFFNAGGQILISAARAGGTATSQNTSWSSLLSSAGTQGIGGNNPGAGTSPTDGTNWYRTDSNYRTFYSTSASSPYGSNTYSLSARSTASSLEIFVDLQDGHTATGAGPDTVDGILTISASYKYPTGTLLPASSTWLQYVPTSLTVADIGG